MTTTTKQATVEIDPDVPLVRITREFDAPARKVFRAHADPDLFAQWNGPDGMTCEIDEFDFRTGGSYRYTMSRDGFDAGFHGSFHDVITDRLIVQTFTFDGAPDGVALEKLRFEDLGDDRSRLVATSLVDSFSSRDAFVASGMESGVQEGYRRLDALLDASTGDCAHLPADLAGPTPATPEGCTTCLADGRHDWVHLRVCQACGHVGCCDSSPARHATAHAHTTGHAVVRSMEPGENWWWCYVDEIAFEIAGAPDAPVRTA